MRLRTAPPVTQTPTVRGLYTNAEMIKRCAAIFGQLLFLDRTAGLVPVLCICCIFSDCEECEKMTGSGGGYERWELHYSHMLPPSPPTSASCSGERGGNNNNIKFLFPQNLSVISNKSVGCFCWLSVRTFCPPCLQTFALKAESPVLTVVV